MRQVRASGAYESLSTEIRKDLGDSIKKAFQNVDSILEDMLSGVAVPFWKLLK